MRLFMGVCWLFLRRRYGAECAFQAGDFMHATVLKKASGIMVALAAMGLLSACGQSRYQPVIAEDVFAPAYKVDDRATAQVQTLFTDQPESTSKATYSRTAQNTGGTASSTSSASTRAEPVVTRPRVLPVGSSPQTRYNCAVAPTTQEQFAAYQRYCTNLLRPSSQAQVAAQPTPANAPSRPVFVSRSFNCTMEPRNKAELTFFRAHCLAAVAAPIKAPVNTQVAAQPTTAVAPTGVTAAAAPQASGSTRTLSLPIPRPRPRVTVANRPPAVQNAPIPAPVRSSTASNSQQPLLTGSFQPSTDSTAAQAAPAAPAEAASAPYDCNILPTTREELELYQVSCS